MCQENTCFEIVHEKGIRKPNKSMKVAALVIKNILAHQNYPQFILLCHFSLPKAIYSLNIGYHVPMPKRHEGETCQGLPNRRV